MPMQATLNCQQIMDVQNEAVFRKDVNESLHTADVKERGFGCFACIHDETVCFLVLENKQQDIYIAIELDAKCATTQYDESIADVIGFKIAKCLQMAIPEDVLQLKQIIRCGIDNMAVLLNEHVGNLMLISGWISKPAEARLMLRDENSGDLIMLEPYYYHRPDIDQLLGPDCAAYNGGYGFVALCSQFPNDLSKLNLVVKQKWTSVLVSNLNFTIDISYIQFIKRLFMVKLSPPELEPFYTDFYLPLLKNLQANFVRWINSLPCFEYHSGSLVASPASSLIIPLYGKDSLKLLDAQVMVFSEDSEFLNSTELIYVIDDPSIVDAVKIKIEELYNIYRVPVRYVYKATNQGFACANNLGASIARGSTLIFLNSDVFPEQPGWIMYFREYLEKHIDVGLIAGRLLYPDGSLQHAGMVFRKRECLNVWTNVQPLAGLDPSLDPATGPREIAAATGACVAMRRSDFDAINGWSGDYIIGDFEDSDICLKIRQLGKSVVYLPNISMVHLERQSFCELGESEYKTRLAVYNAVVHQSKWQKEILASLKQNPVRV